MKDLIDIRRKEYDVFLIYRDAINEIIINYISQHKALSESDEIDYYFNEGNLIKSFLI